MVFQLRPEESRRNKYPAAQDPDFLGYDRPSDRWKVDASGIRLYASGVSVELDKGTDSVAIWSASGTPSIPTYLEGGQVTVDVDLDESTDSVRTYSASGTPDLPVYLTSPITLGSLPSEERTFSRKETIQDLSAGALDYSTNFSSKVSVKHALIHTPDSGISEYVLVYYDSKNGANYDTLLASGYLVDESHVSFFPDNELILEAGDEIKVTCSDNTSPSTNVYVTILGEILN